MRPRSKNPNPTMTRQHFEAIARTLADLKPNPLDVIRAIDWRNTVRAFERLCASSNPGFQSARFNAACGLTED